MAEGWEHTSSRAERIPGEQSGPSGWQSRGRGWPPTEGPAAALEGEQGCLSSLGDVARPQRPDVTTSSSGDAESSLGPCEWALLTMASVFIPVPFRFQLSLQGLLFRRAHFLDVGERIPACFCQHCCRSSCVFLFTICACCSSNLGAALIFCIS